MSKLALEVQECGLITINGIEVAHMGDDEMFYLNPSNWIRATRDLSLEDRGAAIRLICEHLANSGGLMS